MTTQILNISTDEYLSDPCAVPSLSYSVAKILLEKSPLHAWQIHPKLGGLKKQPTPAMELGTLVHKFMLGEGHEIVILDFDDFRKKEAQEQRDHARSKGFTPILRKHYEEAFYATEQIANKLALLDVDLKEEGSQNEFKIQFESDGVLCRRAIDSWHEGKIQIRELKTINNAHPNYCAKQAINLGYDVEASASMDAVQTLHPELAGRIDFIFIFCELEPPFSVYVARPDGMFWASGDFKWNKAKRIWKECLETNNWPEYQTEIGWISAPMWSLKELMEQGLEVEGISL